MIIAFLNQSLGLFTNVAYVNQPVTCYEVFIWQNKKFWNASYIYSIIFDLIVVLNIF